MSSWVPLPPNSLKPLTAAKRVEVESSSSNGDGPPREARVWVSAKHAGEILDVSEATIWRWAKTLPGFPPIVKISPGCSRLNLQAILAYPESRGGAE